MLLHQVVDWIEAAYSESEVAPQYKEFSCMRGRNPVVGFFFTSSYAQNSDPVVEFEEIKDNIRVLDSIILASPVDLSQEAKVLLFKNFAEYKTKDPAATVVALQTSTIGSS